MNIKWIYCRSFLYQDVVDLLEFDFEMQLVITPRNLLCLCYTLECMPRSWPRRRKVTVAMYPSVAGALASTKRCHL